MIFLVVSRKEVRLVQHKIKEIDPKAFVVVTDAYETFGEGFKQFPGEERDSCENRNEKWISTHTNTLRLLQGAGRKLFVETYGCQMNVGDTEIVVSVMQREGYVYTDRIDEADVILINTCSIRDNAEQRIWGRLAEMKRYRRANVRDW